MDFFDMSQMNWWSILVGALIYMFTGALWYGPIAGKAWMAEMGYTEADLEGKSPVPALIKSQIAALVFSFGLAVILYNPAFSAVTPLEGALIGAFLAVVFTGAGSFPNYAFESRTLRHFLIHQGNIIVAMALTGAVMGFWR